MENISIKVGQEYKFAPTGKIFRVAKVTDKRVSWYLGRILLSSWGKNEMRMAWTSIKNFENGINKGLYLKISDHSTNKIE